MANFTETNIVADLSELNDALNQFLDIADSNINDPLELSKRFQGLSKTMGQITTIYGADLTA